MSTVLERKRNRYQDFNDLYIDGEVFVLREPSEGAPGVWAWLQIPSPAEKDTINQKAQVARSLAILTLKDPDSEEVLNFKASMAMSGVQDTINAYLALRIMERRNAARDEVSADKDWVERYNTWLHSIEIDIPATPAEKATIARIKKELEDEINSRVTDAEDVERDRLTSLSERSPDLFEKEMLDAYIDFSSMARLVETINLLEAWYTLRICDAPRSSERRPHKCTDSCDHWDLSKCTNADGEPYPDGYEGLYHPGGLHDEANGCRYIAEADMPDTVIYTYDHAECGGHKVKVFESAQDLLELPEGARNLWMEAVLGFRIRSEDPKE